MQVNQITISTLDKWFKNHFTWNTYSFSFIIQWQTLYWWQLRWCLSAIVDVIYDDMMMKSVCSEGRQTIIVSNDLMILCIKAKKKKKTHLVQIKMQMHQISCHRAREYRQSSRMSSRRMLAAWIRIEWIEVTNARKCKHVVEIREERIKVSLLDADDVLALFSIVNQNSIQFTASSLRIYEDRLLQICHSLTLHIVYAIGYLTNIIHDKL